MNTARQLVVLVMLLETRHLSIPSSTGTFIKTLGWQSATSVVSVWERDMETAALVMAAATAASSALVAPMSLSPCAKRRKMSKADMAWQARKGVAGLLHRVGLSQNGYK